DELVMSANGVLVKGIDRSSVAMISESSALSTALASLDATGRRVLELAPQGAPTTILQVEGLAPASYFLVAVDILGMVHNRKLIKQ
ncbi:MAG TPA: hypothetical protein PL070_14745, partial [Flavobacteriales bacterium]|nr:hypothetical protein [Flavobacteriales bacterium]